MGDVEIRDLSVPDLQVGDELTIDGIVECIGPGDCSPDDFSLSYQTRIEVDGFGAGEGGSLGSAPEGVSVTLGIQSTPGLENAPFWEPGFTDPPGPPLTLTEPGEYTVTVTTGIRNIDFDFWDTVLDEASTTFTVTEAKPDISVGCDIATPEVGVGEPAEISVTATNVGGADGVVEVDVLENGSVSDTVEVAVPADTEIDEVIEIVFEEPGDYDIAIETATA